VNTPERTEVLYCIAVLSMHSTRLEEQAAVAPKENAEHLRARAEQTDRVVGWLNAMSIGEGQL
jgi:hypothetical protein